MNYLPYKYTPTFRLELLCSTPSLFGEHLDSNRLHKSALNRLQYRHDIFQDIQDYNIQILTRHNLTLKFEITVNLTKLVHHPLPLCPPSITAQSLPPSIHYNRTFLQIRQIYKKDSRIHNILLSLFRIFIHMYLLIEFLIKTLSSPVLREPIPHPDSSPEQDQKTSLLHIMIVKITIKNTT